MIFLDTGFYFAILFAKDENHNRAQELLLEITEKKYGAIFTSDFVLDESMTLVNSRTKGMRKVLLGKMTSLFIGPQPIANLIMIQKSMLNNIIKIQLKYTEPSRVISFTDASNIFLCQKFRIENIISFDDHYNGILSNIR